MALDYPKPSWRPSIASPITWNIEHLEKYLNGKKFSVYANGSCIVWPTNESLTDIECDQRLLSIVTHHPDFKVRMHSSGDFLVTFRGGGGGVMSGEILKENISTLRYEAFSKGKLFGEKLKVDEAPDSDDAFVIAGLYVRALLYLDAENPVIVAKR